jgi:hypothetical protein
MNIQYGLNIVNVHAFDTSSPTITVRTKTIQNITIFGYRELFSNQETTLIKRTYSTFHDPETSKDI